MAKGHKFIFIPASDHLLVFSHACPIFNLYVFLLTFYLLHEDAKNIIPRVNHSIRQGCEDCGLLDILLMQSLNLLGVLNKCQWPLH
jgi:hypothetical protein